MDNHENAQNWRLLQRDARKMTKEIDRAAEEERHVQDVVENNETWVVSPVEEMRGESQQIGVRALGGEALYGNGSSEIAEQSAGEREIVGDEQEINNPETNVGEESSLQVFERQKEDDEDLQNETNRGALSLEQKVAAKSGRDLANETMIEVDNVTKKESFLMGDLMKIYRERASEALRSIGRPIGGRN